MPSQRPPAFPEPDETEFLPGAITAGTPVARVFGSAYPDFPNPWRRELLVDNSRGSATLTLQIHAGRVFTRRVGPGAVVAIKPKGAIVGYTVDASANTGAADVAIYENGGLVPGH